MCGRTWKHGLEMGVNRLSGVVISKGKVRCAPSRAGLVLSAAAAGAGSPPGALGRERTASDPPCGRSMGHLAASSLTASAPPGHPWDRSGHGESNPSTCSPPPHAYVGCELGSTGELPKI